MTGLPYADDFSNPAGTWDMLKVLFVLGIIVGLIILLLRFFAKRNRGWWMNRSLRSLGGVPLGTNKSMQVVEWNGRIYVLGIGDNVTLLESITDPELVASLLAEHDTAVEPQLPGLPQWLHRRRRRTGSQAQGDAFQGEDSRPDFEATLENRLRQLAERRQRVEQLLEEKPSKTGPENHEN